MISFIAVHNVVVTIPEPTKHLTTTIYLWGMLVSVIALLVLTYLQLRLAFIHKVSVAGLNMTWMLYIKSLVYQFKLLYTVDQLLRLYPDMDNMLYKKFWVWDIRELAVDKVMFDYVKDTLSSEEKNFVINYIKENIENTDSIKTFYNVVNEYYDTGEKECIKLQSQLH